MLQKIQSRNFLSNVWKPAHRWLIVGMAKRSHSSQNNTHIKQKSKINRQKFFFFKKKNRRQRKKKSKKHPKIKRIKKKEKKKQAKKKIPKIKKKKIRKIKPKKPQTRSRKTLKKQKQKSGHCCLKKQSGALPTSSELSGPKDLTLIWICGTSTTWKIGSCRCCIATARLPHDRDTDSEEPPPCSVLSGWLVLGVAT